MRVMPAFPVTVAEVAQGRRPAARAIHGSTTWFAPRHDKWRRVVTV
jgi:hypothetical protein